jgi:hypothetical protein
LGGWTSSIIDQIPIQIPPRIPKHSSSSSSIFIQRMQRATNGPLTRPIRGLCTSTSNITPRPPIPCINLLGHKRPCCASQHLMPLAKNEQRFCHSPPGNLLASRPTLQSFPRVPRSFPLSSIHSRPPTRLITPHSGRDLFLANVRAFHASPKNEVSPAFLLGLLKSSSALGVAKMGENWNRRSPRY